MVNTRFFILGFALCLFGCAAVEFTYKWYGLEAASYKGKLLGPTEDKDLDLSICEPDAQAKGKCIVMLKSEFKAMQVDYLDIKQQLVDCQKGL